MLNRQRNPLRRARRGARPRAGCPPVVAVAVLAMALSACVSSEPPPADARPVVIPAVTTQPAIPPEPVTEDIVTAVEDYWVARDQAFAAGAEAGIAFIIGNNHPLLPYTADQCREAWFDGEIPIGFTERTALLDGSVESDPGWTMVQGPLAARDLGAGLFEMVVAFTYEGEGLRVADRVANVHLQVVAGEVRQFLLCEEVDVIIAEASATAATTPATTGGTGTTTPTSPTTGTPVAPSGPTTLPPITATPQPPNGGGGDGGDDDSDLPVVCSSEGIEFGPVGEAGEEQPAAGDYGLIPSCGDIDNSSGEDGGLSEPSISDPGE